MKILPEIRDVSIFPLSYDISISMPWGLQNKSFVIAGSYRFCAYVEGSPCAEKPDYYGNTAHNTVFPHRDASKTTGTAH